MATRALPERKKTKYEQVTEELAMRIERGEFKPDTPLPPIRDLMRMYGFSLATVTRALSILESRGLLRSTRGKGVFVEPQRPTASLSLSVTVPTGGGRAFSPVWNRLRIGVVSTYSHPRAGEMWWSRVLAGVDEIVRETGGVAQVRLVTVDRVAPADLVARCVNEGINALFNLGDHWKSVELLALSRAARERRLPVVMAWTSQPRPLPLHLLELDNQIGVEEAVNHLVVLGHQRIGFLEFDEAYAWVVERAQAFHVAMAARGLQPALKVAVRQHNPTIESSPGFAQVAQQVVESCTALVCANDDLAAAMLKWGRANGVSVPEDLSIVGFDDDSLYRQFELTTVHDDLDRLGREGVRLLAHLLESGDEDMRLTLRLPARLVVRRTTAGPRSRADAGK